MITVIVCVVAFGCLLGIALNLGSILGWGL